MKNKKLNTAILNTVKTLILPVCVYGLFVVLTGGRFGKWDTMKVILGQSVQPMVAALGLSVILTLGMWDFSAGAVIYGAAIFGGNLQAITGTGLPGMVLFCILIAVVMSGFTGWLFNRLKVPSMVVTMGMCLFYECLPRVIFHQVRISGSLTTLCHTPWCFIVFAIMFAIYYIAYSYTPFGHNLEAIGSNKVIARNTGLNIPKMKQLCFLFEGLFLGVSAVLYLSQNGTIYSATTLASMGPMFNAMMGVWVANVLKRYCNFTVGCCVGAFTMKMVTSGLIAVGFSTPVRDIFTGFFLLILLSYSANQGRIEKFRADRRIAAEANAAYAREMAEAANSNG